MAERDLRETIDALQQRLAVLETGEDKGSRRDKLIAGLRLLALVPIVGLPLLILLQILAESTHLPLGVVCFLGWAATVLLWFFTELFTTQRFRFSLARLLLAVTLFSAILGYGQVCVFAPYMQERSVLESIQGGRVLSSQAYGPELLRRLLGDRYFERIEQIVVDKPGGDDDIPRLHGLSNLRFVYLKGPGFTNDGLRSLSALPESARVMFDDTKVTLDALEKESRLHPKMGLSIQSSTQVYATLVNGQQ